MPIGRSWVLRKTVKFVFFAHAREEEGMFSENTERRAVGRVELTKSIND